MPTLSRRLRLLLGLVLLFLVVFPLLSSALDLVVDWFWFRQEGFRVIYTTILKAQITLSGLASLGFIGTVGLNLLVAHALSRGYEFRIRREVPEFPALDRFRSLIRWLIWGGVLLVGYGVGQWAPTHWTDYLLAQKVVPLGEGDPVFGIDLGFYLFRLPYLKFLFNLAVVVLFGCVLSALFLYLLEGGVWVTQKGATMAPAARAHLMVLVGLLFVLLAYRLRLAMYGLLFSPVGIVYGAGYTDVHATLPVLWASLALSLAAAGALVAGAFQGSLKPSLYAIGALAVVGLVGGTVYPEIVQRLIVAPNEIEKERPYIARAIEFTRRAYALDRFEERKFSAVEDLSQEDIRKNDPTIRNVRLWDHNPLRTTFAQLQEIRTYYDFERIDNDRYWIDGTYRQVSLSPRELSAASLPSRTWINEHLIYTHGYGLCLGPVNEFTSDGLPVLFIKDIPPVSSASIRITRPEIYFGELKYDYCFVDTRLKEFDYPAGDQNVYSTYQGTGGMSVGNFWRRLLFTLKFGELKILLSTDIRSESRLMIYRSVLDRARRLTPFLIYDRDPYMVATSNGKLTWILDGYTTSSMYPYSDPYGEMGNYIRNSVKATIDAYTGRVHFYISDTSDPLIQAYSRLFPRVFEPLEAMPQDLRAHIRYPEDFFSVQASKYAVFHMTDPRVFYNKEDLWRVAQSAAAGPATPMAPYYTIMKLAEVGTTEEFILMVPFTPSRKDNMIAWMAARCDPPNYGKVLVFYFPKQRLIYGPQQIESRIDQDPLISQALTLWGQGGSKVVRGTLLVIPILNSVLYIEPLYLAAEASGALPQLKRIIVSYSDKVVMEPTLDAGLSRIFGGTITTAAPPAPEIPVAQPAAQEGGIQTLIREANEHFERAQAHLREGNWTGYGVEIKELGSTLKRLAVAQPTRK